MLVFRPGFSLSTCCWKPGNVGVMSLTGPPDSCRKLYTARPEFASLFSCSWISAWFAVCCSVKLCCAVSIVSWFSQSGSPCPRVWLVEPVDTGWPCAPPSWAAAAFRTMSSSTLTRRWSVSVSRLTSSSSARRRAVSS